MDMNNMDLESNALVSVGIPTFNRPEGLRRTLDCILSQTYKNIQVTISDNASTDPQVEKLGREFAIADRRVNYVRQNENIGAWANFQYVLSKSSGKFFMWAADDDEWSPFFIEKCLANCLTEESVACKFDTFFRSTGLRLNNPVPTLDPASGVVANLRAYFECMQPSLFYGLHKRSSLDFFNQLKNFDFVDCYFVLRLIVDSGVRTLPEVLYTAGVDEQEYRIKYANANASQFDYASFYLKSVYIILATKKLSIHDKLRLLGVLKKTVCDLIRHHDHVDDPKRVLRAQVAQYCLKTIGPNMGSLIGRLF